jgi:hypothetical protein
MASTVAPAHTEHPFSDADGASASGLERAVGAVERRASWALLALLALSGVLFMYMGRGLSFFYDDWDFVTHDYGGGLHTLLVAHVGNISVFPVVIYKVLFHLVGLNHYAVFRLVVVVLHLVCGALVYVLAARRIPRVPALLAAALILFLGAAWEDLLWAFQVGYMLSVAGGLAAWVLLENKSRRGDALAMLCVIVSAGSSSLGIAVMIGIAAELAWERRWRSLWIVGVPAFLYLLWYAGYGESQVTEGSLIAAPGFAADLAAAAFGGLVGRSLEWGRPLALVGGLLLLRHLVRAESVTARLAGMIAAAVGLWVIIALARSTISQPETSRYIYLGCVAIVLIGVELLRHVAITARATAITAALVLACAITGLTVLHNGAMGLRATSTTVTAELGAMEIAAAYVPPNYQPDPQRAPQIEAGPYLHTVRAIGSSPADTPADIIGAEPAVRSEVDSYLIKLEGAGALASAAVRTPISAYNPLVANVVGPQPTKVAACWRTGTITAGSYTEYLLPVHGLLVRAGTQSAQVAVRRFSTAPADIELGSVPAHGSGIVKFPLDASGRPWFVRLTSSAPLSVCGAR